MQGTLYTYLCLFADFEKATLQHLQHIVGTKEISPSTISQQTAKIQTKSSSKQLEKPWQLPPNRYDTSKIPYEKQMGIGGAYWPKNHKHQVKPRPNLRQQHTTFYSLPKLSEKIFSPCNRAKGVFLTSTFQLKLVYIYVV